MKAAMKTMKAAMKSMKAMTARQKGKKAMKAPKAMKAMKAMKLDCKSVQTKFEKKPPEGLFGARPKKLCDRVIQPMNSLKWRLGLVNK